MKIEDVKRASNARGSNELIAHLEGKAISFKKALLAKCYECMAGYADGKMDCKVPDCPLYPFMPYSEAPKRATNRRGNAAALLLARAKLQSNRSSEPKCG